MLPESKGRVLFVEGDASLQRIEARKLEQAGFEMQLASDGKEALTAATQRAFDVVICDFELSRMGGLSLVHRLQERDVGAAFVLLCADRSNAIAVEATESGVLQVLQKPVDSALLQRVVKAGVEQTRRRLSVLRFLMKPSVAPRSVAATDAKNEFGQLLETASRDGAVVITKHDAPKALLVSADRVSDLLGKHEPNLKALSDEFDQLVARMRTPKARAAARGLFTATPKQFGEAALAGADKRRG